MDRKLECRKGYPITSTPIRQEKPQSPIRQTDVGALRSEQFVNSHLKRERLPVTPDKPKPARKDTSN